MAITKLRIGPADHGRKVSLAEFATAEAEPGHLYELARGVVSVVEVPGLPHGKIVSAMVKQIVLWDARNPGIIRYQATGGDCAIRLPGMQSERHPDVAIYLTPEPDPVSPWDRWVPDLTIEVVSPGSEQRDYVEKRAEYLAAGVREYWIVDPSRRAVLAQVRTGDVFRDRVEKESCSTALLPGFALDVAALFAK